MIQSSNKIITQGVPKKLWTLALKVSQKWRTPSLEVSQNQGRSCSRLPQRRECSLEGTRISSENCVKVSAQQRCGLTQKDMTCLREHENNLLEAVNKLLILVTEWEENRFEISQFSWQPFSLKSEESEIRENEEKGKGKATWEEKLWIRASSLHESTSLESPEPTNGQSKLGDDQDYHWQN